MIGIRDVACYLPDGVLTSEELSERLGFKPGFLENKVGVETRHVAADDESTADMATRAFANLLERRPSENFDDIGLVLLCTQNPDYKMPHTASLVQHRLGLSKKALSFDVNLACSGYVTTLVTAKALMGELGVDRALVFTAEPYSKIIDPDDRTTVALFGDAASVTVLERGAPLSIGRGVFGNDGSRGEAAIVWGSGTARENGESERFRLDRRGIFEFLKREVPVNVRDCAEANGLRLQDIDLFLFHQASAWLVKTLKRDLELPDAKVPMRIKHVGNTVSTSIPLLLEDVLYRRREPELPRTALLAGFGAGLAWGAVVVRH